MGQIKTEELTKIIKLFHQGYQYKEIIAVARNKYGFNFSMKKLKQVLRENSLRRKNIKESSLEEITLAIWLEIRGGGRNLGYRSMCKRLQKLYLLVVKRKTVLDILRILDPEGIEARRRHRLRRRMYKVPGPNYVFHIDGHDKITRYGFTFSGAMDGWSRRVVFLRLGRSNKDPKVIARYFLDAVIKLKFLPAVVRVDHGTENYTIRDIQQVLRYDHNDPDAGEKSFKFGKSTANQRIERFWRDFRGQCLDCFINLFKNMEECEYINVKNPLHIECLRFCFGAVIQHYSVLQRKEWNEHRIRMQHFRNVPGGIPNVLYYNPENYGGVDCRKELNLEHAKILYENYTSESILVNQEFEKAIRIVKPNVRIPNSMEEAYNLYNELVTIIDDNITL